MIPCDFDFEQWLKEVDDLLVSQAGCTSEDLPYAYRDAFESGDLPEQVVDRVLADVLLDDDSHEM